ncbi:MAG TPA: DUF6191 domain-containing protein [Mycobacteriales bacterium]|nr:DUF6191 domain-containing protein [Mycobacteriales bacterium]
MSALVAIGIPLPAVLVLLFWLYDRRRGKAPAAGMSGTYTDEFTAVFYGTKRMELEHRQTVSMMRDDTEQGAPPRVRVDLDRGTARIRPRD